MKTVGSGQWAVGSELGGMHSGLLSPVGWFFVVALLLAPIVAHGCHGDDVDHEPGAGPPARYHEPENGP